MGGPSGIRGAPPGGDAAGERGRGRGGGFEGTVVLMLQVRQGREGAEAAAGLLHFGFVMLSILYDPPPLSLPTSHLLLLLLSHLCSVPAHHRLPAPPRVPSAPLSPPPLTPLLLVPAHHRLPAPPRVPSASAAGRSHVAGRTAAGRLHHAHGTGMNECNMPPIACIYLPSPLFS